MKQLFALPEYEYAFAGFVHTAICELMRRKHPLLSQIQTTYSEHIPTVQNTMPSGEVVESRPFKVPTLFTIQFDDAIGGRINNLIEGINNAAEQALNTDATDIRANGPSECGCWDSYRRQPLTMKLLLQMFENTEIDFDKDGKPKMGIFVGPEMYQQILNLPPCTQEKNRAWNELLERKRAEFNARQRRRKLS